MYPEILQAERLSEENLFERERFGSVLQWETWRDTVRRMARAGVLRPAKAVIEKGRLDITFFDVFRLVIDECGVRSFDVIDGTKEWESPVADRAILMHPARAAGCLIRALVSHVAEEKYSLAGLYYDGGRDTFRSIGEYDDDLDDDGEEFEPHRHFDVSALRYHLARSLRDFQTRLFERLPWLRDAETMKLMERIGGDPGMRFYAAVFRNRESLKQIEETCGNLLPLFRLAGTELYDWREEDILDPHIAHLPEDVVRKLVGRGFGKKYRFSRFLDICAMSDPKTALRLFMGLRWSAFAECWKDGMPTWMYYHDRLNRSWTDEAISGFLERMVPLVEERNGFSDHCVERELRAILAFVERQPSERFRGKLSWRSLLDDAAENPPYEAKRISNVYEGFVEDGLNITGCTGLWWRRRLPDVTEIRGCAVHECASQSELAQIRMEFGWVPPYSDDIAPAMKGNRLFVDARSPDGETVLMEFDRMSEGFVMSGIHSKGDRDSSWARDIGMEIEDMLYEGRRYLFWL